MYFVYIIKSQKDDSYYIGSTENLEDRLTRHNQSRSKYTKAKIPWKLAYSEVYKTRSEAMYREYEIKKQKSRKYIENLIKNKNT